MSEQTTHTTNNTVDPQFLGPEAGQQAGGNRHGGFMSELQACPGISAWGELSS